MVAKLKLELEIENLRERFDFNKSSVLQGVLMECIDTEYAEFLHNQEMNPYSHYVLNKNGRVYWVICTLNEEAYRNIICRFTLEDFKEFYIKHNNLSVRIVSKELITNDEVTMLKEAFRETKSKFYTIKFITPTAFKRSGGYLNFPDLENIFRSLARRYNLVADREFFVDMDDIEKLVEGMYISSFKIESKSHHLDRTRIPGFVGEITVKANCDDRLKGLLQFLIEYGRYSGVGVKTSIGMGAIE